jgi:hypothetical protein
MKPNGILDNRRITLMRLQDTKLLDVVGFSFDRYKNPRKGNCQQTRHFVNTQFAKKNAKSKSSSVITLFMI